MFSSSQFVSAFHGDQKEKMLYIANLFFKRELIQIQFKRLNRMNIQSINKKKPKTKALVHFVFLYIHSSCKNGTNFRRLELRYTELHSLGIYKINLCAFLSLERESLKILIKYKSRYCIFKKYIVKQIINFLLQIFLILCTNRTLFQVKMSQLSFQDVFAHWPQKYLLNVKMLIP